MHPFSNDLLQKRITISLNSNGTYTIQESTVSKYNIGSTINAEDISKVIAEGIKPIFSGDLRSEYLEQKQNILLG